MAPRLPIVDEGAAGAEERTKLGVEIFVQQFEADWSEVLPSESNYGGHFVPPLTAT